MVIELRDMRLEAEPQRPIKVYYKNELAGEYFADILVEKKVILKLKALANLIEQQEASLLKLTATNALHSLVLSSEPPKFLENVP